MQHEWIGIRSEFRDDEGYALCHGAGDESDVPGEPIQLGHDHRTALLVSVGESRSEARAPVERIGTLAGFHLDILTD